MSDREILPSDYPLPKCNYPGDTCPKCGSLEVDALTPRTVYGCGSSDYDQRPETFTQSEQCAAAELGRNNDKP